MDMDKWNPIPQFFYDMIGRFCPGAIVMITALIVFKDTAFDVIPTLKSLIPDSGGKTPEVPLYLYLAFALFAYLIADILHQIWEFYWDFFEKDDHADTQKNQADIMVWLEFNSQKEEIANVSTAPDHKLPKHHLMLDDLRLKKPGEAMRLLKIRAEARLSSVIVVGYFILFLFMLYILCEYQSNNNRRIILFFLLSSGILSYIRAKKLYTYYLNGLSFAWLSSIKPGN